ncbi:hypothetical protein F4604DRAFT_1767549 [Suillus subluteus]|nr:hypothetical protein F4604DRAFT_1767549 [Suillus subluteus]
MDLHSDILYTFKSERQPSESGFQFKHVHRQTQLAIAAKVPPEVIVMILGKIPRPRLPQLDLFSPITPTSSPFRSHVPDVALVSAPLVCMSWRGPATEVLYEHINLQTTKECEILHCTLQSNPSFGSWVKVLHLPRGQASNLPVSRPAASTTAPARLLQLSADIFRACNLIHEIDIMAEFGLFSEPSEHTYLRSIRVTDVNVANSILGGPRPVRFFALRELTLNGFHFDGSQTNSRADSMWPEFSQLTKLRLEHCTFVNEDLTQILPRSNARLKRLELFDTCHPFRSNNFELPDFLSGCLEELWIEDCWPWSFEPSLRSYQSLRTVHVDWDVFSKAAPFLPIGVRVISVNVPVSVASSAPDYENFEASLRSISMGLPSLERVIVSGDSKYPLLQDVLGLKKSLNLQAVRLRVNYIQHG